MALKSPAEPWSSSVPQPNWTREEDGQFEKLLAEYTGDQGPELYEWIASRLQNKSVDQASMHHAALAADLEFIDAGLVPMTNYRDKDDHEMVEDVKQRAPKKKRPPECKWTEDEHRNFLIGLEKLKKGDWRGISRNFVMTRSPTQVASHAQKYFKRKSEQGTRRRRSIHDITIGPLVQASYTNPSVSQLQNVDHALWPEQEQVDQSVSESQHIDPTQRQHQQLQNDALMLDSQNSNRAQQQEQHQFDIPQLDCQDNNHAQWHERQKQKEIDKLILDLQYADCAQWQEYQQQHQQEIDQLVAELHNGDIQPLEEQLMQHEHQGAQKGRMIQQELNRDDQVIPNMTLTEVIEGQRVQEGQNIQQNSNGNDQLIPIMHTQQLDQRFRLKEGFSVFESASSLLIRFYIYKKPPSF